MHGDCRLQKLVSKNTKSHLASHLLDQFWPAHETPRLLRHGVAVVTLIRGCGPQSPPGPLQRKSEQPNLELRVEDENDEGKRGGRGAHVLPQSPQLHLLFLQCSGTLDLTPKTSASSPRNLLPTYPMRQSQCRRAIPKARVVAPRSCKFDTSQKSNSCTAKTGPELKLHGCLHVFP